MENLVTVLRELEIQWSQRDRNDLSETMRLSNELGRVRRELGGFTAVTTPTTDAPAPAHKAQVVAEPQRFPVKAATGTTVVAKPLKVAHVNPEEVDNEWKKATNEVFVYLNGTQVDNYMLEGTAAKVLLHCRNKSANESNTVELVVNGHRLETWHCGLTLSDHYAHLQREVAKLGANKIGVTERDINALKQSVAFLEANDINCNKLIDALNWALENTVGVNIRLERSIECDICGDKKLDGHTIWRNGVDLLCTECAKLNGWEVEE